MYSKNKGDIRYLTPMSVDSNKKKYCRFKKRPRIP